MPLLSAAEHYATQRKLLILALGAARRAWSLRNMLAFARTLSALMDESARNGFASVGDIVAEQGIDAPLEGEYRLGALSRSASDGRPLLSLLTQAGDGSTLDLMALTQVADAGRIGQGLGKAARPALTGYTRYLNLPSCGRCVVLAGRVYRWSTGFLRHPRCDCVMVPSTMSAARGLVSDPREAFESGQVRGLSQADVQAIRDGADIAKVVNVRRFAAGLSVAGRALDRNGLPTPEGIYHSATDREDAIRLLRRFGFIL